MAREVSFNDFEDGGWTRNQRTGRGPGWRADDDWDAEEEKEEEEEGDASWDEEDDWEDWEDLEDSSEEVR